MKRIAISLHLDSLAEAFGWPAGFDDPTFGPIHDRFEALADRFGFRYTVFVIGRDLDNTAAHDRVRRLAHAGHEIANHSLRHDFSLAAQSRQRIQEDLERSHDAIAACSGQPPVGFVSPAWSASRKLHEVLQPLGYRYDASAFPSPLMYAMIGKSALSHLTQPRKCLRYFRRRDWLLPLHRRRDPYLVGPGRPDEQLVMMPLPTAPGPAAWGVWHTLGFVSGWDRHLRLLREAVRARPFFYYVVHPADYCSDSDVTGDHRHSLERMTVGVEEKLTRLARCFELLAEEADAFVSMCQLSEDYRVSRCR